MQPIPLPTAMIVLASEQLWPNLHGLVHWHRTLRHLCIYHTAEERISAQPAQRLALLCRQHYPHIAVHLSGPQALLPAAVAAQIQAWRHQFPDHLWLINASGGNKLMYAGVLRYVGCADTTVVYRELSGEWFTLLREGSQGIDVTTLDVPPYITDRLPVADLVRVQWQTPDTDIVFAPPPQAFPVAELTRVGMATGWEWREMFRRVGYARDAAGGLLFEQYIAAVFLALGVSNLACNVVRRSNQEKKDLQEIDLVANHGGGLLVVDCKLRSQEDEEEGAVEALTSQIRQATQTRRELGGLGARFLLVRPNRFFTEAERALAEQVGMLSVLDRQDAPHLFRRLADFARIKELPPALQEAEDVLQTAMAHRTTTLFSRESAAIRAVSEASASPLLLDLDYYRRDYLRSDWLLYRLGGIVHCYGSNPTKLPAEEMLRRLTGLWGKFGTIAAFALSNSRRTYRFQLHVPQKQRAAFYAFLEERLRQSSEEEHFSSECSVCR